MTDPSETANTPNIEGPGSVLRRARKARGLELRDIAQELHLDEWMLQALEEDDFPALGAPVFAKGHMRKYGSMLGLNPDDLMIAYYRKRGRDDSPPPIARVQGRPPDERERSWMSGPVFWLLLVVAAMLVLSALWVLLPRDDGQEAAGPESGAGPVPEATVPNTATLPPVETIVTQDATMQPAEPAPDEQADSVEIAAPGQPEDEITMAPVADGDAQAGLTNAPEPEAPVVETLPAAVPGSMQITLNFNDESWVEVSDADNERLLYNMVAAGRTRTLSGRPPITIFLGRARAVEVQVDGNDYPIPADAIRRNTARFVVDAAR